MSVINKWEDVDPGVKRKIHAPGKGLMMMEVQFEKGAIGPAHRHPHEQLSYCLKGKFEFTLGDEKITVSQGESLYIPGDTVHGVVALEPGVLLDAFTPLREDLLK